MTRLQWQLLRQLVIAFLALNRGIRASMHQTNELEQSLRAAELEQDEPNR